MAQNQRVAKEGQVSNRIFLAKRKEGTNMTRNQIVIEDIAGLINNCLNQGTKVSKGIFFINRYIKNEEYLVASYSFINRKNS